MKLVVGFSRPKSKFALFGQLIMLYNRTPYSHCYIKYTTLTGVPLVSQASKGMLNIMSVPAFNLHNDVIHEFELPVTPEQLRLIKKNSMEKAGLPYSVKQIFGIVMADIFGLKVNPFDTDRDTFVCSEYLGQILLLLGYELPKDLSLLTPKDIYEALEKLDD
jgi:hypothetical protein